MLVAHGATAISTFPATHPPCEVEDARHMGPVYPFESRRIPFGRKGNVVHRYLVGWLEGGKGWKPAAGIPEPPVPWVVSPVEVIGAS